MEPLKNEPGLEASPEKALSFYNAYIRMESVETAMIGMLKTPPTEFSEVIPRHFKRSWASLIRPDLVTWAEKYEFEDSDAQSCNWGQIMRLAWFRSAVGPGNYKKMMMSLVHRMDELVEKIRGFDDEEVMQQGGKSIVPPAASSSKEAAAGAASLPSGGVASLLGGGASK